MLRIAAGLSVGVVAVLAMALHPVCPERRAEKVAEEWLVRESAARPELVALRGHEAICKDISGEHAVVEVHGVSRDGGELVARLDEARDDTGTWRVVDASVP